MSDVSSIYNHHLTESRAITPHLPHLRSLASDPRVSTAVEFGVKHGASSSALLMGDGITLVTAYDITRSPHCDALQRAAGGRWDYRIEDSRFAAVPECDLLFIDSLHTYTQCNAELTAHAHKARVYIAAHDVMTFGTVGGVGESGEWAWVPSRPCEEIPERAWGIRLAFDQLMVRDPSWRIKAIYPDSHGLLVLERS